MTQQCGRADSGDRSGHELDHQRNAASVAIRNEPADADIMYKYGRMEFSLSFMNCSPETARNKQRIGQKYLPRERR